MKKKWLVIIDILCLILFSSCGEMNEIEVQQSENISESVIISEVSDENSKENESENQIQNYNIPKDMTLIFENNQISLDNFSEIFDMLKNLDFNNELFITNTDKSKIEIKFEYDEDIEKYFIFSDAIGYIPSVNQDTICFAEIDNEFYNKITDAIINRIAENNFFSYYDEDIKYSESCESHILDNFSYIIDSGIYNEYFIETNDESLNIAHDVDVFNEWRYYNIYSDEFNYKAIEKNDDDMLYACINDQAYVQLKSNHSILFLEDIFNNYEYVESCYFVISNEKYTCEKYKFGNNICFLYFAEGELKYAIKLKDNNISVIYNYYLYPKTKLLKSGEWEYVFSEYKENALKLEESEVSINYENEFFDFSAERIRLDDIENPHIVENYRNFFDTADEFSIYITAKRGDLMMSNRATKSGESYYYMSSTQVDGEEKIISENININGKNYSRCYYENKPDNYTLYENTSDSTSTDIYIYYLIQNNDRQDSNYVAKFIEAYNVMINNDAYICEVWSMGGKSDYYVYCKDDKVVAIDVVFYDEHEETVIEYMNDYAEIEYISESEHYNIHNSLIDENIKNEEG